MANGQHQERRKGYAEIDPQLIIAFKTHLDTFEERQAACKKSAEEKMIRLNKIDAELEKLNALTNTADGFIRATRMISAIIGILVAALGSILVWVVSEKNNDMRLVQQTLQRHSSQIERTLTVVERLSSSHERDSERLERHLDSINSKK